jgi:hypothetical protein
MRYKYECGPASGEMGVNKENIINDLAEWCSDMETGDDLIIYDFGKDGDILLEIQREDDDTVRFFTSKVNKSGVLEFIDSSDYIPVTPERTKKEMEDIWELKWEDIWEGNIEKRKFNCQVCL